LQTGINFRTPSPSSTPTVDVSEVTQQLPTDDGDTLFDNANMFDPTLELDDPNMFDPAAEFDPGSPTAHRVADIFDDTPPYPASSMAFASQLLGHANSAESTPTLKSGRISNAQRDILQDGFKAIDAACAQLAAATGFTEDRVIALWNKNGGRATKGFNYWNVYEAYLAANLVEELQRAGFDVPAGIKWDDISHKERRICYTSFQETYPENMWEEILHVFNLSRKCERSIGTFAKRKSDFQSTTQQLVRIVSTITIEHESSLTLWLDRYLAGQVWL
jgi:hypothetical protein